MKAGWQTKTLGEACEVMNGGTPKTGIPEYWDGGHLWITPAEMGNRSSPYVSDTKRKITDLGLRDSSAQMLPPNSVVLSSRAPIGHLVINTEPMATNQGCKGLIPGSQIQHKFLYYYLSSIVDLLNLVGTGATFKELSGGKLKEVTIPVPSLSEQRRIVGILDEAFEGIATAKANAEKNLQNARAVFESHLNAVFTQRGEGWVDSTLGEILTVLRNGFNCKQDKSGKGNMISRIESIWNAEFDVTRVGYAELSEIQREKFRLQKGDVLFSHINSAIHVGKTALFDVDEEVFHGVNLLLMRPKPKVSSAYLDLYLKFIFARGYWLRICKQSINQASVNQQDITRVPIRFPRAEQQVAIVAQMDSVRAETQHLESIYQQKLDALEELKKSLLHQAFTGAL